MAKTRNNRAAGHNFERKCVNAFKEIGFTEATSSRLESRAMDNKKVDLCKTEPYYIQCKNTKDNLKYHDILDSMPKENDIINVILHKKTKKAVSKFVTQGEYAILKMEDFLNIIKQLKEK